MSRKKGSTIDDFIYIIGWLGYWLTYLLIILCIVIIRIIMVIVSMILFYTSSYKKKTGYGFFKTYFNKGYYGEYKLYRKIRKIIDQECIVLNTYLPSMAKNVDDTEIDIIAISNKHIYCFEMKNYKGKIYGYRDQYQWSQYTNYRHQYKFYNPLRQNEGHVSAIENYLCIENNNIVPIVVFSNKADISNVRAAGVLKMREIGKYLKEYEGTERDIFSNAQVEKYINKLKECANASYDVKMNHVADVRELKKR